MQRGLIDYRARDGGGPIGQRSDGQSIEPVGPVRVQVALDGNLVELLWHARFLLHARRGDALSPHCQRCLSHAHRCCRKCIRTGGRFGTIKGWEWGWKFFRAGDEGVDAGRWLLGEQVECSGACHRLGAALHLELTVDGIDIRFDSAQCQDDSGCNLTIGEASRNEAEYFQFALGQRVEQRLGRSWCRGCSRRGTFLKPFTAQQCEQPVDVCQGYVRRGGTGSFPRMFVETREQDRHGWAFIYKHANVALRLSQHQGAFQWHKSSRDVALQQVRKRLQHQDFDDASRPLPFFRRLKEVLQEFHCLKHGVFCTVALRPGQEHSGQGDVFELAQVAEVIRNGEAKLTRPVEGFTHPPLGDPHPCHERCDRTHLWEEVTHIQALCLVEQVERAGQISFGLSYASHRNAPTIAVLW